MPRTAQVRVQIIDENGSFRRLLQEAPKVVRRFLSTAVFLTAGAVHREMESRLKLGPEGEGLTPTEHIKHDVEHRGKSGSLNARVGIFDDEAQVAVATYQEYGTPQHGRHPAMKQSAQAESEAFKARAIRALQQMERYLSQGW